jgi:hypothetical protein
LLSICRPILSESEPVISTRANKPELWGNVMDILLDNLASSAVRRDDMVLGFIKVFGRDVKQMCRTTLSGYVPNNYPSDQPKLTGTDSNKPNRISWGHTLILVARGVILQASFPT